MSLKKARDYVKKEGYITVGPDADKEAIRKELEEKDLVIAYIVDSRGRLKGRYYIDKAARKVDGRYPLVRETRPYRVERTSSLTETLSRMLEYGEKLLPVVTRNDRFMGVIDLDSIFEEVEQAGSPKGA